MKPASTSRSGGASPAPRPSDGRGNKGEGNTVAAPPIYFPAVALPQGDGSYVVSHGKPVVDGWIGTREAMKLVGYKSRASIHEEIIPHPLAKKHLRWKLSPGGGKLLINRASLMRFLEAVAAARQNPPRTPQADSTMPSPPAQPKRAPSPLRRAAGGIVVSVQTSKMAPAGRAKP